MFEGDYDKNAFVEFVGGPGTRMVWYPHKAMFRAGKVSDYQWDPWNSGDFSVAMGEDTIAYGDHSVALGGFSYASGEGVGKTVCTLN